MERHLAGRPTITVPTVVLEGGSDGVDPAQGPGSAADRFTDLRRWTTLAGVGHDLPQEAPGAFADAVRELARP